MDPDGGKSSPARKWWLLIGGVVVFAVAFSLLERLVREPAPSAEGPTPGAATSVSPPVLLRLDDGAIEIRHDFFRRTTIRVGNEEERQALFTCLEQGLEQAYGGGTEGWTHESMRSETHRIQDACMGSLLDVPGPPHTRRGHPEGSSLE